MRSIHIVEKTLPMAWEKAVLACWEQGESFPTEYDKPGDPHSRDVTALIQAQRDALAAAATIAPRGKARTRMRRSSNSHCSKRRWCRRSATSKKRMAAHGTIRYRRRNKR